MGLRSTSTKNESSKNHKAWVTLRNMMESDERRLSEKFRWKYDNKSAAKHDRREMKVKIKNQTTLTTSFKQQVKIIRTI